jgi:hypothetical protein
MGSPIFLYRDVQQNLKTADNCATWMRFPVRVQRMTTTLDCFVAPRTWSHAWKIHIDSAVSVMSCDFILTLSRRKVTKMRLLDSSFPCVCSDVTIWEPPWKRTFRHCTEVYHYQTLNVKAYTKFSTVTRCFPARKMDVTFYVQ